MAEKNNKDSNFDELARNWDENPDKHELANSIAKGISANTPLSNIKNALEFGCGTGLVGLRIAKQISRLTAIDSSDEMVKIFNQKAESLELTNASALKADIFTEENLNSPFDFIFSSMVLHHVQDLAAILSIFAEISTNGSWLAIADLDKEDGSFHAEAMEVPHDGFEREQLSLLIEQAGFAVKSVSTVHEIKKDDPNGQIRNYPVFLITAQKL